MRSVALLRRGLPLLEGGKVAHVKITNQEETNTSVLKARVIQRQMRRARMVLAVVALANKLHPRRPHHHLTYPRFPLVTDYLKSLPSARIVFPATRYPIVTPQVETQVWHKLSAVGGNIIRLPRNLDSDSGQQQAWDWLEAIDMKRFPFAVDPHAAPNDIPLNESVDVFAKPAHKPLTPEEREGRLDKIRLTWRTAS